jgi:hypothetical protein
VKLRGFKVLGAQEWIRTITPLRALRPEHSASTNFATWAYLVLRTLGCKDKYVFQTTKSLFQNYITIKLQPRSAELSTLPFTVKLLSA